LDQLRINFLQKQTHDLNSQANNDANSAETLGIVTETILKNQEGFITTSGLVRGVNTTGSIQGETWADGDMLYLSGTVAGRITKVKPSAPIHTVIIGYVVRAHATEGQIYVKMDNGYELDELHNVKITAPANKQSLFYNESTSIWENRLIGISDITGLQSSLDGKVPTSRTLTINGVSFDLSANRSWSIPTHDAVTIGTANGLSLSGQQLSLGLASASSNGALSASDWSTFNNKQNALTNPITGTGTLNYIPKFTASGSIGDSLIFDNGTNVGIGTTSRYRASVLLIKCKRFCSSSSNRGAIDFIVKSRVPIRSACNIRIR